MGGWLGDWQSLVYDSNWNKICCLLVATSIRRESAVGLLRNRRGFVMVMMSWGQLVSVETMIGEDVARVRI